MVSLIICEQSIKAIKNAYLVDDDEIDKVNRILGKEHSTLISLIEDEEFNSLDRKLKELTYCLLGNSDPFPFPPSDILKFAFRENLYKVRPTTFNLCNRKEIARISDKNDN